MFNESEGVCFNYWLHKFMERMQFEIFRRKNNPWIFFEVNDTFMKTFSYSKITGSKIITIQKFDNSKKISATTVKNYAIIKWSVNSKLQLLSRLLIY